MLLKTFSVPKHCT